MYMHNSCTCASMKSYSPATLLGTLISWLSLQVFGERSVSVIENDVKELVGGFIGLAIGAALAYFLAVREANIASEVYVMILGSLIPVSTVRHSCCCW